MITSHFPIYVDDTTVMQGDSPDIKSHKVVNLILFLTNEVSNRIINTRFNYPVLTGYSCKFPSKFPQNIQCKI